MTDPMTHTQESEVAMDNYVGTCDPDGILRCVEHFVDGKLQDAADGTPAARHYSRAGYLWCVEHYQCGELHNSPDGAAVRVYKPDGSLDYEEHWVYGEQVR